MANLPETIASMKLGKGVYQGDAKFLMPDGSVMDKDGKEISPASALGAAAYSGFSGYMPADTEIPEAYTLPAATAEALGGITMGTALADSTAETVGALVTEFNALLAALRTSGVLATPET